MIQYYPDKTRQMERALDNKTGKVVLRLYNENGLLEREDTGFKEKPGYSRFYDEQGNIKNPGENP
jgi:antitoxin component YwqK of YwqJK toxin-antitoxin module